MSADGLERFDAYQKALSALFDFVVEDMTQPFIERKLERLVEPADRQRRLRLLEH